LQTIQKCGEVLEFIQQEPYRQPLYSDLGFEKTFAPLDIYYTQAIVLNHLGSAHQTLGDLTKARQYYVEALGFAERTESEAETTGVSLLSTYAVL
jgi:hypothetical protein